MFVRGGTVRPGDHLYDVGYEGDYWSSVSGGNHYAYFLGFGSGYVDPYTTPYIYRGFSIRCVALGG